MIEPRHPIVDDPSLPESIRKTVALARGIRRAPVDLDKAQARLKATTATRAGRFTRAHGAALFGVLTLGCLLALHEVTSRTAPAIDRQRAAGSQAPPEDPRLAPAFALREPRGEPPSEAISVESLPLASPKVSSTAAQPDASVAPRRKTTSNPEPRHGQGRTPPDFEEEMVHLGALRILATTDPAAALAAAERGHAQFPKGVFYQEREAIAIEALKRLDRHREAEARARRFVATFPHGPFTERVGSGLDIRDPD